VTAAAEAVGPQLGISRDTSRRRVAQADVDDGRRAGVSLDPVDLRHYLGTSYWPKRW
jgi:hypothetical protein